MSFAELVFIAIALAMDAFAVSVTEGIRMPGFNIAHAFKVAFFFGGFQALMPAIGFLAGSSVLVYIENFDHWVVLALLGFIGIRMIVNACKSDTGEATPKDLSNTRTLLMLSIATSIDALAVGIGLAIEQANLLVSTLTIGSLTAVICFLGTLLGRRLGVLFQKRAEIIGGVVLVAIGLKTALEHILA